MAKRAIVMYLEQARIYGEDLSVTRSEVLLTKPDGKAVLPHNRIVTKADNKTMGESFLNELIYVLGAGANEPRQLPFNREVLVYTSNENDSDNYRTYLNAVNTGTTCPVHNFKLCQRLRRLCEERGYRLTFSQNSLLGTSVRNDAMTELYGKHEFPVVVRNSNTQTGKYQQEALKCGVKFCRITRKWVKIKWKYYAQLVLEGYPPTKCDSNGVIKHPIKQGCVGLDIGTQTLAISGSDICDLRLLAPSARAQAKGLVNEIARTQRAMDRSRRATNPDCYNPDGTIKRLKCQHGHKQKRDWKYSKRYYRLRARLRDLNRRLADIRKMEHNILANELLEHGNEFIVEDMNYKALQKRSKETKVNAKTGRIHTKKRFGKSLSRCAPAMFITILTNKVTRYGGKVIKVSTFETKASQFDHTDESYTKKKLSERMAHLSSGEVVQRDLYSAFLLEHIDTESLEYNTEALKSAFPAFLKMHENTKKHLQKEENNLPASVGF